MKKLDRDKKLYWYKLLKHNLYNIKKAIATSKKGMEHNYYKYRYTCQLEDYAKALGVKSKQLEKYIK